ncbi:hypothetical protein Fcan01_22688 [Folsomia candida]|uniref:BED-type domain-containing protein n=1 Tax=Folsomia candida TaxID=158441 RepID=A0A226DBC6_FOLCA|nr:hypothetical protein Fcan01_22688 [Folsomia candida]
MSRQMSHLILVGSQEILNELDRVDDFDCNSDTGELAISEEDVLEVLGDRDEQKSTEENMESGDDSDYTPEELLDDDESTTPRRSNQNSTKRSGGRLKDKIWQEFMESYDSPGSFTCKRCDWTVKQPKRDRLKKHFETKCGRKRANVESLSTVPTKTSAVSDWSPDRPSQHPQVKGNET